MLSAIIIFVVCCCTYTAAKYTSTCGHGKALLLTSTPPPQGIRGPPGMIGSDGANGDPVSIIIRGFAF